MNKVFRVIWNHATQTWTAVSELSTAKGKTKSSKLKKLSAAAVAVSSVIAIGQAQAAYSTQNGAIVAGSPAAGSNAIVVASANDVKNSGLNAVLISGYNSKVEAGGEYSTVIGSTNVSSTNSAEVIIGKDINSATGSGGDKVLIGKDIRTTANKNTYGSVGIGHNITLVGKQSIAIGEGTIADTSVAGGNDLNAIAIGGLSRALAENAIGFGVNTTAQARNSLAVGQFANATAQRAIAIGSLVSATQEQSTVVGSLTDVTGTNSGAFGAGAVVSGAQKRQTVSGGNSYAFGNRNAVASNNSFVLGNDANVSAQVASTYTYSGTDPVPPGDKYNNTTRPVAAADAGNVIAIGTNVTTSNQSDASVVIGKNAKTFNNSHYSVVVGADSSASASDSVVVGRSAKANAREGVAIGTTASISGLDSIRGVAIGWGSRIGSNPIPGNLDSNGSYDAVAIGSVAQALVSTSVALGSGSQADRGTNPSAERSGLANAYDVTRLGIDRGRQYQGNTAPVKADERMEGYRGYDERTNANWSGVGATYGEVSLGQDGVKRQITNLAGGNDDYDAVNIAQLKNVGVVVGGDTNAKANGKPTDFLVHDGQLNILGDGNRISTVSNDDGAKNSKVNINFDYTGLVKAGDGIKVDEKKENGKTVFTVTSTATAPETGKISWDSNGKATYDQTKTGEGARLTNVSNVVDAINNAHWNVNSSKAQGSANGQVTGGETNATAVKAGTTVNVNAGDNIKINRTGTTIDIATAKDLVNIDSIAKNSNGTGPKITFNDGNTTISGGNLDVAGNKITNVSNGTEGTDAVNLSQLNKLGNNTIKLGGDNSSETTPQTLNKEGGIKFDVVSKDAAFLTTAASGSQVAIDLTQAAKDKINREFAAGDNITITRENDSKGSPSNVYKISAKDTNTQASVSVKANSGLTLNTTDNTNGTKNYELGVAVDNSTIIFENGKLKANVTASTAVTSTEQVKAKDDADNIATVAPATGSTQGGANATYEVSVSKNAVKDAAQEAVKVKGGDTFITVTPTPDATSHSTTYSVTAKTGTLNNATAYDTSIPAAVGQKSDAEGNLIKTFNYGGKISAGTEGLATVQNVADAVNSAYWKIAEQNGNETVHNTKVLKDGTVVQNVTVKNAISAGHQVNFANGRGTISNVTVNGTSGSTIVAYHAFTDNHTVTVNQAGEIEAVTPIVYTDKDGNRVYKQPDGTFNLVKSPNDPNDENNPAGVTAKTIDPKDVIASINTGTNSTTNGSMIVNNIGSAIKNKDGDTYLAKLDEANKSTPNAAVNVSDLKNTADELTNKGLRFDANNGGEKTNKLGSKVTVKGTGTAADSEYNTANIKTTITQDTDGNTEILVGMAKDLTGVNSISNTTNGPKLTFNEANGGNPANISISGGNLDLGGNQINNVKAGEKGTDAVNVDQLKAARTKVTSNDNSVTIKKTENGNEITYDLHVAPGAAQSTWNVKSSAVSATEGTHAGDTEQNIKDGKTVEFQAGKNLTVTQTNDTEGNTKVAYSLDKDIEVDNVVINGKDGKDGAIGLKGKDGTTTTVTINKDGKPGVDGAAGTTTTRLVVDGKDIATLDDGMKYGGDTGAVINKKLNEQVNVIGGVTDEADLTTVDNIGVVSDGKNNLKVKLAKDLDGINSISNGSTSITFTKDGDVSITGGNLNLGGAQINNVANGTKDSDAVNLAQLNASKTVLENGTNTNVTGTGTKADPYKVNVEGALKDITSITNKDGNGKVEFAADQVVNVAGDNTIKLDGKTGDITGLTNKNLDAADFGTKGRAATEEQLKIVNDSKIGDNNFNLTGNTGATDNQALSKKDGLSFGVVGANNGEYISTVASGAQVAVDLSDKAKEKLDHVVEVAGKTSNVHVNKNEDTKGKTIYEISVDTPQIDATKLVDGKNTTVEGDGSTSNPYKVNVNDNLVLGKDGKDGTPGKDGSIGVNGADGSAVVINGKDGSIGLTGPRGADGAPGANATLHVVDGAKGLDGNDGKDGESKTRIEYIKPNGDKEQVATLNDGLKFTGNNESVENTHKLNTLVKVQGEGVDEAASKTFVSAAGNINVVADGNDKLEVKLNKDINLTDNGSLKFGDNNVNINKDGLTITGGPNVTKSGIDAGNKTISNVANGTKGTDAVNLDQLNASKTVLENGKNTTVTGTGSKADPYKVNVEGALTDITSVTGGTGTGKVEFAADQVVNVAGDNTIKLDGKTGDITGLTNKNLDAADFGKAGRAATEEQLKIVNESKIGDNNIKLGGDTGTTDDQALSKAGGLQFNVKGGDNGKYVSTTAAGTDVTVDLTQDTKDKIDNAANQSFNNINNDAKKVITGLGTIVKAGDNVTVSEDEDTTTGQKTYTVNAKAQNLGDAELKYKANGDNEQSVKVSEGLNFVDGNYTTASVDANGQVKYDVNLGEAPTVVNGKPGKPGEPGVNGKDGLTTVKTVVDIVNNSGWNANATGNVDGSATSTTVNPGETVNFAAGKNLTVKQEVAANGDQTYTYNLANEITIGEKGEPGTPGKDGVDGSIGVNGKDGSAVVINGKDGSIGLNGKDGKNGVSIKGQDGKVGVDGKDGETRLVYVEKDNPGKTHEIATTDDGLHFGGDIGNTASVKLNKQVDVKGGETDASKLATGNNIGVTTEFDAATGNATLKVQLAKNIDLGNDGSVTTGNTVVNNSGITITNPTDNTKTVSLTDAGLNNGGNVIKNVAEGKDDTDAVNVAQLKAAKTVLKDGKNTTVEGDGSSANPYKVNVEGDLTNITSITGGNGTGKVEFKDNGVVNVAGNNPISLDGSNGTIGGLTNKTFDPNNFVSGQAATEDQLKALGDQVTTNVTNTLTTKGLNFKGNDGKEIHKDLGETLEIVGKGTKANTEYDATNIKTYEEDGKVVVALAKDLTANKVTVGEKGENGKDGVDGQIGVNGKDGSAVVINGKDGSIGLNGKDGANGLTIKGADGKAGVDGKDGETKTRIVYETKDPKEPSKTITEEVATLNDGLKFKGDNDTVITKKLNEQLDIVGGAKGELTENNIGVNHKYGKLVVQLAKDIDLGKDGSVTTGNTKVDNNGITITAPQGGTTTNVTLTQTGLDNGGNKIKNVANGTEDSDAVNLSQLKANITNIVANERHIKPGEYTVDNDGNVTMTYVDGNGKDVDGKAVISGIAKQDLSNINKAGETKIQNLAKDAIEMEDGENTVASSRDNNGVKTFKVDVKGDLANITSITANTGSGKVEFAADQVVNVAGDNTIKLDGKTGDITGLTNKDLNAPDFGTKGRAATEEQLKIVDTKVDTKISDNDIRLAGNTGKTTDQKLSQKGGIEFNVVGANSGEYISTTASGSKVEVDLSQKAKDDIKKGVDAHDTVTNKGLTFNADNGSTGVKKLGDQVAVNGDGKNIETVADTKGVKVKLKDDISVTTVTAKTVNTETVKAGDTTINDNGVTIKDGPSVTKEGIDAGNKQITNVAPGVKDTDAVNVGQLKRSFGDVYNKMNQNRKEARAGIAGANAAAGLPQAYLPGKSMVAAAAGTFKGQNALAVGYSRASDNGKVILKLQGNANSQGDVGASVGVGYQW